MESGGKSQENKEEDEEKLGDVSHHHDLDETPEIVHELEASQVNDGVQPAWEEMEEVERGRGRGVMSILFWMDCHEYFFSFFFLGGGGVIIFV